MTLTPSQTRAWKAMMEALGPFANAARDVEDAVRAESDIWESPAALNIYVGDLRRATKALTLAKDTQHE